MNPNAARCWYLLALLALVFSIPVGNAFGQDFEARMKARMAVEQMYLDVLGRSASDNEIDFQIGQIYQGKSLKDIRNGIILSEECKNAIHKVFKETHGRNATEKELNRARKFLAGGKSLTQLRHKLGGR